MPLPRIAALLLPCCLLLNACATRVDRLDARLGLTPPLPEQQVAPERRAVLDRDFQAGLAALERNDLDGAVAAWRRYAEAAPFATPEVRNVRGYLTLLERERAKRFAREAVLREQELGAQKGDRLLVALMPFQLKNETAGEVKPFNRAILAMVATDLAQVPSIRLLERRRIDALIQEMQLSDSGLVDAATALRGGRMLGAGTVVAGSVYNGAPPDLIYTGEGKYTIAVSVSDVPRNSLLGVQEAYGSQKNFFELEKQVVHGILDMLGVKERPDAVNRIHTRNWDAYAQFTLGLKHLAEDRFQEARAAFALALRFDPNFALAESYHLDTPARALTPEQIVAEAGARR